MKFKAIIKILTLIIVSAVVGALVLNEDTAKNVMDDIKILKSKIVSFVNNNMNKPNSLRDIARKNIIKLKEDSNNLTYEK